MKYCTKCYKEKDIEEFHKHPGTYDRRFSSCKECSNKSSNKYYETLREDPKKYAEIRKRYDANRKIKRDKLKKPIEEVKTCKICKVVKEPTLEFFYANHKAKDKLNSYCKECDREAARKRYAIIKADPVLRRKESERVGRYVKAQREREKLKRQNNEILCNTRNQGGDRKEDSGT